MIDMCNCGMPESDMGNFFKLVSLTKEHCKEGETLLDKKDQLIALGLIDENWRVQPVRDRKVSEGM